MDFVKTNKRSLTNSPKNQQTRSDRNTPMCACINTVELTLFLTTIELLAVWTLNGTNLQRKEPQTKYVDSKIELQLSILFKRIWYV